MIKNNLKMLYCCYPSTEYKKFIVDNFIKNEENNNNPKTYKVTVNIRKALARIYSYKKITQFNKNIFNLALSNNNIIVCNLTGLN
jgi:hypothetical protein